MKEEVGKRITVMDKRVMRMEVEVDGRTIIIEIRMEEEGTSTIIEVSTDLTTIIMKEMALAAMKKMHRPVLVGALQLVNHKEVMVEVLKELLLHQVDGGTLTQFLLVAQQILTKKPHNQVVVGEILNLPLFQNQEVVEDGEDQNLLLMLLVRYKEEVEDGVVLSLQLFKKQIMDGGILRLIIQLKIKEMAGISNKLSLRAPIQQYSKERLGVDLRKHKKKMKILGIVLTHLQNLPKHLISVNKIMKIQVSKTKIT